MRDTARSTRETEIEAAAYRLLEEKGFAGTTVQAIAREARASNETLYRWYGDKTGLFRALIDRNAGTIRDRIADLRAEGGSGLAVLERLGAPLLAMLLGDRAVALNRAAAADAGGELGAALAAGGRDTVAPLVRDLMAEAVAEGALSGDPGALAEDWLTLLVGDLQIRRVTGALPFPPAEWITERASGALDRLCRLHPAGPRAASVLPVAPDRRVP